MFSVYHKRLIEQSVDVLKCNSKSMTEIEKILLQAINHSCKVYSTYATMQQAATSRFEQQIVKTSFYTPNKACWLLAMCKSSNVYILQLERYAMAVLRLMQDHTLRDQALHAEFHDKADTFLREFRKHTETEQLFNKSYNIYLDQCVRLTATIDSYKMYSDPIYFYREMETESQIMRLETEEKKCMERENGLKTDLQLINTRRKALSNFIKDVSECYTRVMHKELTLTYGLLSAFVSAQKCITGREEEDCKLEEEDEKNPLSILNQNKGSYMHDAVPEDIFTEYRELFQSDQITSTEKFFYERCERVRDEKIKSGKEAITMQELFIKNIAEEKKNIIATDLSMKTVEREVYGINGGDSYKKKFRHFFGQSISQVYNLCLYLIDRPRRYLEKAMKSIELRENKLLMTLELKKESIQQFSMRSKVILSQHLKLQKQLKKDEITILRKFKKSVVDSCSAFKKQYFLINNTEKQLDERYYMELKAHFDLVHKQFMSLTYSKLLQKEKNRLSLMSSLSIDSQIMNILKQDPSYQKLLNESLLSDVKLKSNIKTKEYEHTLKILKRKHVSLKGLYKMQMGCCGASLKPIKHSIHTTYECRLSDEIKGQLKVASVGLVFSEKRFNPFADKLKLTVLANDIVTYSCVKDKLSITTQMGLLHFNIKMAESAFASMQKHLNIIPLKDRTSKNKLSESTSLIQNKSFRLSQNKNSLMSINNSRNNKDVIQKIVQLCCRETLFNQQYQITQRIEGSSSNIQTVSKGVKLIKTQYHYKNNYIEYSVKEQKQCLIIKSTVSMSIKWKVSFPKSPTLSSFLHQQHINIDVDTNKMIIAEGQTHLDNLFVKNQFYVDVQETHRRLATLIQRVLQDDIQVMYEKKEESIWGTKSIIQLSERKSRFSAADSI